MSAQPSQAVVASDRPPLPADVARVADALWSGLRGVLGDHAVSFFLYGALAFPHPPQWRADVDFHVFVARPLDARERARIEALHDGLDADLDGCYVTLADARRREPPPHQLDPAIHDEAWALHRAHVLAGRYFLVSGTDPAVVVMPPTWDELDAALRNEMAYVRRHPEHMAFGILDACRVRWSSEHRDVVVSKYEAAQWARATEPAWRDAIDAAVREYRGTPAPGDRAVLERDWGAIVGRSRQPARPPRASNP